MRILPAILSTLIALATAQPVFASQKDATLFAENAWNSIEIQDWRTAAILLEHAVAANPDSCLAGYYEEMRVVATEAVGLQEQGWNESQIDTWYEGRIEWVVEDCWE